MQDRTMSEERSTVDSAPIAKQAVFIAGPKIAPEERNSPEAKAIRSFSLILRHSGFLMPAPPVPESPESSRIRYQHTMGQQYNKVIKKRRRTEYLKRRKEREKANQSVAKKAPLSKTAPEVDAEGVKKPATVAKKAAATKKAPVAKKTAVAKKVPAKKVEEAPEVEEVVAAAEPTPVEETAAVEEASAETAEAPAEES
jgi:hypothetical protein